MTRSALVPVLSLCALAAFAIATEGASAALPRLRLRGTLRLLAHLSARTCSGPGEASGTAKIDAAPEGAPPGSYEVERVG